jgi:hypothetical protein
MAAGLGFKDFTTGEVLTATDVDGYLMQGIWVFANATARDAAVTSPQEGNFAFLKDTNTTTYYTGSAWTNLDTTGMVNPMTTTGDTIYSSSGSTPARLGIGTAGQVLRVNSGATAPEWATPATGGGMTLISTTTLTGSAVTLSSIPQTYVSLVLFISGVNVSVDCNFFCKVNATTQTIAVSGIDNTTVYANSVDTQIALRGETNEMDAGNADSVFFLQIDNYASTTFNKTFAGRSRFLFPSGSVRALNYGGSLLMPSTAISSLEFGVSAGTFSAGTILLYGVK